MRARTVGLLLTVCCGLTACSSEPVEQPSPAPQVPTPAPPTGTALKIEEVAGGLEHPWDVGFLPDGKVLVTQRPGRLALLSGMTPGATVTEVDADFADVLVKGEGGLMGLAVHPDFVHSRRFVTCQTRQNGGSPVDVRVVTWTLSPDGRSAQRVGDLLTGLPVNASGRHSGCRPTVAPDGALLVGTGDIADHPGIPQDRKNLGGKVLRIDLRTGEGLPDNPFASSPDPVERRLLTYGHRNVQGVAVQPGSDQVFISEHGPRGRDEVSKIIPGRNYGWDPSRGGTTDEYDESVSMSDTERFPDAVPPLWTSGSVSEAPSGAAFLAGTQWGQLEGRLAVVALRGQKMLLFRLDGSGAVTDVLLPPEFNDTHGRLRAARLGPDGALYVSTSTGDNDKILRVTLA
ncbi:PQQ-dependent sugar dehydrogenase [Amycolatopsis suaedae]|uniref:PQQ-dependent sugar dehydrogenase n=1 Tax=Amycolatopsis suaedae TaxID=2510978 RepID=A0A4Q7J983_9PSEU|nr:PQQ-dependent sugar dehydrogenase [Amycolatopsis suaedae]RZQ63486.1 PQQ-dependent sugar dehydrogenase [Amycolatopsis suaedae]